MSTLQSWLLIVGIMVLIVWVRWEVRRYYDRKDLLYRQREKMREAAERQARIDREWGR